MTDVIPGTKVLFNGRYLSKLRQIPPAWIGYIPATVDQVTDDFVVLTLPAIRGFDSAGKPYVATQLKVPRGIDVYPEDFPDEPFDSSSPAFAKLAKPLPRLSLDTLYKAR